MIHPTWIPLRSVALDPEWRIHRLPLAPNITQDFVYGYSTD